jgi:ubiquinone/menaquinone biosynthesis C-methylase UbiE
MAKPPLPLSSDSPITADSDRVSSSSDERYKDTQSLPPALTNYPVHWGRTYHRYREGAYPYPNDEDERNRLDHQHAILNHYFDGRLVFADLDPETTQEVLDIGTGTGLWCIELADTNILPRAQITGIDLSPIQPEMVPENVHFELQDCTDAYWGRPYGSIDLIHCRFMAGSLESYKGLIRKARRYIRPGSGWLELHEIHPQPVCDDGTMPATWKFAEWEAKLAEASSKFLQPPRPIHVADDLKMWMTNAGYVDVVEHRFKLPLSGWPKDPKMKKVGEWNNQNWLHGLPGFSYKLFGSDGLGWSRNEVEAMMVDVRKALTQKSVHAYMFYYVVMGRMPAENET